MLTIFPGIRRKSIVSLNSLQDVLQPHNLRNTRVPVVQTLSDDDLVPINISVKYDFLAIGRLQMLIEYPPLLGYRGDRDLHRNSYLLIPWTLLVLLQRIHQCLLDTSSTNQTLWLSKQSTVKQQISARNLCELCESSAGHINLYRVNFFCTTCYNALNARMHK